MRGCITWKEVLLHAVTIIRVFGAPCWLQCLRALAGRKPTTFLQVVSQSEAWSLRAGGG